MVEPTDWVGGQLTTQAVPTDENKWIEGNDKLDPGFVAGNRSYCAMRAAVRAWYKSNRRLNQAALANPTLNPGNGWVSRLCAEPVVIHSVLMTMLRPAMDAGTLKVLHHHEPSRCDVDGDRIRAVTVRDLRDGTETTVYAPYFLDATELGDLLELGGVEHLIGAEHQSVFNELHGRLDRSDAMDQQAISWCFALEHRPGESHVISRPENYDFWRNYVPKLDHPWPGKLFSWTICGGEEHRAKEYAFKPWPQEPAPGELEMWRYRRIVDRSLYEASAGDAHPDVSLINMVQMDYFQKPLLGVGRVEREQALREARMQSLCFLYWMQTEAPRFDGGGTGFPGLKLRGTELGTDDGFAKAPYIREARRLDARVIVHEGHVGTEQRRAEKRPNQHLRPYGVAEAFVDSVGIGHYRLDLHPSTAMRNSVYVPAAPFRIPMGALIPKRTRNVLAAGKCLGVSHIANGCYRLHPVEWNIGEAAGVLAAWCVEHQSEPIAVHDDRKKIRLVQQALVNDGVPLAWPWERGAGLE
jgi:hypothetical protein